MAPSNEEKIALTPPLSDALRNWIMVVLTLAFVSLYGELDDTALIALTLPDSAPLNV